MLLRKAAIPDSAKLGLLFFALSGVLISVALPQLFHKPLSPPLSLLLAVGLAMIAVTALLFLLLSRLRLGIPRTVLAMAVGFNACIVVMKFVLSPTAMYSQGTINAQFGDPNSVMYQIIVALGMLLLYTMVFYGMYKVSAQRVRKALNTTKTKSNRHVVRNTLFSLAPLAILAVILTGGGAFFLVILVGFLIVGAPLTYLGFVLGSVGIHLVAAICLAVVLAVKSFHVVEQRAIAVRDGTILASFFWIGFSVIALYHFLWVVFMLTLVHIWPFNTYTPK